jgi:hypothetical protein
MGYLHIDNLYKNQTVLGLEELYALEKVHGTSAHIRFKDGQVSFFSGGEKYENFKKLFDEEFLTTAFASLGVDEIIVNGEAYGAKCQGMSKTYGKDLKFVVFDVRFNGNWLTVPNAEKVAHLLKLEFVHYVKVSTKLEEIDRERDADSVQAIRNGMGEGHKREGVVLRPLEELVDERGNRLIAKHKRSEFIETKTPREVNPDKQLILKEAKAIAEEWVTPMRLQHVLSVVRVMRHMIDGQPLDMTDTGRVISAMIEDVEREAKGEILESKEARTAIGKRTAFLFKQTFIDALKENANARE